MLVTGRHAECSEVFLLRKKLFELVETVMLRCAQHDH